jgi:acyl-CoA dehydrogenase
VSHWLPLLARGEAIGTAAFSEGNDPLPRLIRTQWAGEKLTGTKRAVTAGLKADFAIVLAAEGGTPVLACADLTKATRTPINSFDNSRLHADLTFTQTPATLLATGDAALSIVREVLARMAVVTAHEQLGGAEALMLIARDCANTRKAFGQPIGAFQSVKHRIAELWGLVEIARANCIHAAAAEARADFIKAAAAARLSATEAYDTAARDCVQIHGGAGVTWDSGLHLHMRRARSLAIECGNMFAWEDVLVGELVGAGA